MLRRSYANLFVVYLNLLKIIYHFHLEKKSVVRRFLDPRWNHTSVLVALRGCSHGFTVFRSVFLEFYCEKTIIDFLMRFLLKVLLTLRLQNSENLYKKIARFGHCTLANIGLPKKVG